MRLLSAAWCELETPGVLRRQPFSRNGSFYKGGVDWIGPTCTATKCPSGELGIIQGSCGMNGRVGIHFLPDQFDVTTVDTILFAYLIIHLFHLVFSVGTVFFSHNKSAGTVFRLVFSAKRTEPSKVYPHCYSGCIIIRGL